MTFALPFIQNANEHSHGENMKILIVDDDKDLAGVIRNIVEQEARHVAATAHDGMNGYETYLDFKPDIIITDIEMPGRSGFELMREIRLHDPKIKTIYMSGDPFSFRPMVEKEQKQYRDVSFLGKPFSFERLTRLLSQVA